MTRQRPKRREILVAPRDRESFDAPTSESVADAHAQLLDILRDLVATSLTERQRRIVEMYFFEGRRTRSPLSWASRSRS